MKVAQALITPIVPVLLSESDLDCDEHGEHCASDDYHDDDIDDAYYDNHDFVCCMRGALFKPSCPLSTRVLDQNDVFELQG